MRIAFDLRRIGNPGIGRYMRCLVKAILEEDPRHEYLLIAPPGTEHMLPATNGRCRILPSRLKYYSIHEQFALPAILRRYKVDLLHSPHFLIPLVRPCSTIITIHDVIYLACAGDLDSRLGRTYYGKMIRIASRMANVIVTDSEYSKQDIVRYLAVDPGKIHVIYPGVDEQFAAGGTQALRNDALRAKIGIIREFILYAGIYRPRKNHAGLLRAFRELISAGVEADLVIAGPLEQGEAKLRQLANELGISDRVRFAGFVDDDELAALYAMARVYACPSLYEGFGFTILESMASGTPVVSSAETSLPEVGGTAALYADARSPREFAAALRRAFSEEPLRRKMVAAGHANVRRFSWRQTGRAMLDLYELSINRCQP